MCKFLCFSFAESAFLSIDETDFFQEVVCWYSSMKKFKIESYKFCALCTLKSHLINLFPVNFLFSCECGVFLPLFLTVVGWFAFSWYKFFIYKTTRFFAFKKFWQESFMFIRGFDIFRYISLKKFCWRNNSKKCLRSSCQVVYSLESSEREKLSGVIH